MKPKANETTSYRGLLIEHWADDYSHVTVRRSLDSEKCAGLAFAIATGCFSDDDETPLTPKEIRAVYEIEAAYRTAGLF